MCGDDEQRVRAPAGLGSFRWLAGRFTASPSYTPPLVLFIGHDFTAALDRLDWTRLIKNTPSAGVGFCFLASVSVFFCVQAGLRCFGAAWQVRAD